MKRTTETTIQPLKDQARVEAEKLAREYGRYVGRLMVMGLLTPKEGVEAALSGMAEEAGLRTKGRGKKKR